MLWPLSVVLVANTNGRLAIPALAGLLVFILNCIAKYVYVCVCACVCVCVKMNEALAAECRDVTVRYVQHFDCRRLTIPLTLTRPASLIGQVSYCRVRVH